MQGRGQARRPARRRSRTAGPTAAIACGILTLVSASCEGDGEPIPGPNVLLITIDTLRADRLGCYGYPVPASPNLDRLAAEGVLFADCSVQWPKTWPSMASLVSGAYPRTTGIQQEHRRLPGALTVLAEVFGTAGYRTAAVVANFNVGRMLGFDQGFEHFVESWQDRWERERGKEAFVNRAGRVKEYTDATTVTDQGVSWLREAGSERPFFLWLHYMDPHGPYVPPDPYSRAFPEPRAARPVPVDLIPAYQRQVPAGGSDPIDDLAFYLAQYDREVLYFDDELGRLRRQLEEMGLLDNTVIVLTADHGESFDEHRYYLEHGKLSYQPTVHVPLVFHDPAGRGGRLVTAPVGLVDVSSSLLDYAGVPIPETFEGQTLVPVARGEPGAALPANVFVESGYVPGLTQKVIRQGRWKLIHVPAEEDRADMAGEELELYDLQRDPAELVNVAGDHPDVAARLLATLNRWYESGPGPVAGGEDIDLESLSPEQVEMLQALGYAGS